MPDAGGMPDAGDMPDAGPGLDGGADAGLSDTPNAFDVWREIREAVRRSPDHLVAESERVVATSDPAQIFAFVRDRFATLPAAVRGMGSYDRRLFGIRGTLRCGAGTLRDKAELLVELYRRAGFEARVQRVNVPGDADYSNQVLVRSVARPFRPEASDEQVARWLSALGMPEARAEPPIDTSGAEARALADQLAALLPGTADVDGFSKSISAVPVVAVTVNGETKHANLAVPDIAFGELGSTSSPINLGAPEALPTVTVALSVVTTYSPRTPVELVKTEIPLEALIGRSLYAFMIPPDELPALLAKPMSDVKTFLPVLAVRAPDMSSAENDAHTYVGSALASSGDVLRVSNGTLSYGGAPLETGPVLPATVARVSSLGVKVDASRFSQVALRALAEDADGASVEGLPASAFQLEEEGSQLSFTLLENKAPPPRVLFVLDKSTSLPPEYQGEGGAQLVRDLAAQMGASAEGATFRVLHRGENPPEGWLGDLDALRASALSESGYGSSLWEALAASAAVSSAHAIVFITDGDAEDSATPEILAALRAVQGAVLVSVTGASTVALDDMASRTGGAVVQVTDQSSIVEQALSLAAQRRKSAYLLRYDAPATGPQTRHITLSVRGGSAAISATYEVPAESDRRPPFRVGGILLSVQVGSATPVNSVLAGALELDDSTPEAVYDEARRAFFGATEVRFEGQSPTAAIILDDLLSVRLGLEPLSNAVKSGDRGAIHEALLATPVSHSAALFALHADVPSPSGELVYPTGVRAVRQTLLPRQKSVVRRVDILPIGAHASTHTDGSAALRAALRATARLAVLEGALFKSSTVTQLDDMPLALLLPNQEIGSAVAGLSVDATARWNRAMRGHTRNYRLVPASGAPVAFYSVDASTGAMLGVLERGEGGAEDIESFESDMTTVLDAFDRYGAILSFGGSLGTAAGTWLSLEVTKARKLLAATVVIAGGTPDSDATNWDDFFCNAAAGAAGGALERASASGNSLLSLIGKLGEIYGKADSVAVAATGQSTLC